MTTKDIIDEVYANCDTKECNKKFYTLVRDDEVVKIQDCKCRAKLDDYVKCNIANIPKEYWTFNWSDIQADFDTNILKELTFFRENIELCLDNKVKFFMHGGIGSGKSIISTLLLKDVLSANFDGYILNATELIDSLYNDRDRLEKYRDAEFLVIDEIDKLNGRPAVINDFAGEVVNYIDRKSLVFISNDSTKQLANKGYPPYFIDRLNAMEVIHFKGKNFRNDTAGSIYKGLKG